MGLRRDELWKLRLRDARADIISALEQRVYKPRELAALLAKHRQDWRLASTLDTEFFIDYLVRTKLLRRVQFKLQTGAVTTTYPAEATLYVKPKATSFEIALSFRNIAFLSHFSAAFIHGITNVVPRIIYTNKEQVAKVASTRTQKLTQVGVDRAFGKPARISTQVYVGKNYEAVFLAGGHTGNVDLVKTLAPDGLTYLATSLERTLIDCTVRPHHAGGIHEVLSMYEAAIDRLSLRRLRKLLDEMAFIYPYRQAIGWLLERAGYPLARVAMFKEPAFELDFYLEHAMPATDYSSDWRLFYPKGL